MCKFSFGPKYLKVGCTETIVTLGHCFTLPLPARGNGCHRGLVFIFGIRVLQENPFQSAFKFDLLLQYLHFHPIVIKMPTDFFPEFSAVCLLMSIVYTLHSRSYSFQHLFMKKGA